MKRLIPLFLLTSCTMHQDERLQELLTTPRQSVILRNEHLVRDALSYQPSSAGFSIEKLDSFSHPLTSTFYALQGASVPLEERLLLASYDPLRDQVAVHLEFELFADNTLQVYTPQGSESVREVPLVLKELLPGQEIKLALISKEKRTCTKVSFTPHPIRLEENGAVYTLQTTHRKGTHFCLHGINLSPQESLTIREQSGNEIREHVIQANASGYFSQPLEPIVLGQLGGKAHVTIERNNLSSSRIDYAWGEQLEKAKRQETRFCPLVFAVDQNPRDIDAIALMSKLQKKLTI